MCVKNAGIYEPAAKCMNHSANPKIISFTTLNVGPCYVTRVTLKLYQGEYGIHIYVMCAIDHVLCLLWFTENIKSYRNDI